MTDKHQAHFDDLDAWDADDYDTAEAAVDSITNDIVFRPPEPPPPPEPATRRTQRRAITIAPYRETPGTSAIGQDHPPERQ